MQNFAFQFEKFKEPHDMLSNKDEKREKKVHDKIAMALATK